MSASRFLLAAAVSALTVFGPAPFAGSIEPNNRLPIEIGAANSAETIVVVEGDHLWKISRTHLTESLTREVSNSEVSPYWREVIAENTPKLRSGDPDLIYPGEVVVLPEVG